MPGDYLLLVGTLAFDLEYARWLDEHQHHINELRVALSSQMRDDELLVLVDGVMMHYDQVFRLKSFATKSDVFHVLSGMWMSPAERFFMWLGGFRSSELLKASGCHSATSRAEANFDSHCCVCRCSRAIWSH
ncbi:hypothetical protein ABZP36_020746 [Zizania latifolia]